MTLLGWNTNVNFVPIALDDILESHLNGDLRLDGCNLPFNLIFGALPFRAGQFGEEKRAGATVDDFELLKVIGKGSFGKVRSS